MTGSDEESVARSAIRWPVCLALSLLAGLWVGLGAGVAHGTQEAQEPERQLTAPERQITADEEHETLFAEGTYPSATTCATCHPTQYREWSVSPHAYAQMSPVFNAFQGAVLKLTNPKF